MSEILIRRIALVTVGAMLLGGALRLWSVIEFPTLDMYDNGPLWISVAAGIASVACMWFLLQSATVPTRLALCPVALATGWSLCFGGAGVANGLFDHSPIRSLTYTVSEHRHGGRGVSVVTLHRSSSQGPEWLRLRERRETVDLPLGTSVVVPVRAGALNIAWRPGPVTVGP